jgi:ABC-2 type transport system ATP-binding protein
VRGDAIIVSCTDSDVVARHLLTATSARDLEISSMNLEAAFVALTGDDSDAVEASR